MDTIVLILILLTGFNFLLKQTFRSFWAMLGAATVAAIFVWLMWPYAIEQSKTQIADFLDNQSLMLDVAVMLTIEVALQMAFCILSVHVAHADPVKKGMRLVYRLLYWFPGVLVFPVLFFTLTQLIFTLPGYSFQQVAIGLSLVVLVMIPLGYGLIRYLLPEPELRLELFFMTNALVAILGIVATVNGQTAVEGVATVDWMALSGCLGVIVLGGGFGLLFRYFKVKKILGSNYK